MREDLFRAEALDFQAASTSQLGQVTGLLPSSWSRITWLLALFMLALLAFLLNVDFARRETVRGKLRIDGAEAKIYAQEPGVIQNVFVVAGELVGTGQPLFDISTETFLAGGRALSEAQVEALRTERDSLQDQITSIEAAWAAS